MKTTLYTFASLNKLSRLSGVPMPAYDNDEDISTGLCKSNYLGAGKHMPCHQLAKGHFKTRSLLGGGANELSL